MAASPRLARVERWMPGVRVVRTYERAWLSRDLIAGIVLVTLLVPQGMAYAELAGLPRDHRAVHDRRLPGRLRARRAVADPGPRPGFVAGADDRRHDPAARGRQRGAGDRPRRDARAPRRARHGRRGPREARLRRRPALEPGPDRLPGRSRGRHLHRPAAEAVRVLHGRQRPRRRGARVRPGPRPDEPVGARDRPPQPGHHPRPQAAVAADARHPRRGRRRDRALDRARPRRAGRRR